MTRTLWIALAACLAISAARLTVADEAPQQPAAVQPAAPADQVNKAETGGCMPDGSCCGQGACAHAADSGEKAANAGGEGECPCKKNKHMAE